MKGIQGAVAKIKLVKLDTQGYQALETTETNKNTLNSTLETIGNRMKGKSQAETEVGWTLTRLKIEETHLTTIWFSSRM